MSEFTYQAMNSDEQLVSGQLTAANAAVALAQLESQGLRVLLIRQVNVSPAPPLPVAPKDLLLPNDRDHLLRNRLTELLDKRAVLAPALAAFSEELPTPRARRNLRALANQLQEGITVDELVQSPTVASRWLPLLGSSRSFGTSHLENLFAEAQRASDLRSQLVRSLLYPASVLSLALVVFIFLAVAVVPTISSVFDDFQLSLPLLTLQVVTISGEIRFHPLRSAFVLALCCLALYGVFYVIKRWVFTSRVLGVLFNGNSIQVGEMASFVRRLAEALNAGLPLPAALELSGRSSTHGWLRREATSLASAIAEGTPITTERLKYSSLPATVVYALQAGHDGQPNVRLLQEISENYSQRLSNRFNWATGFLPQLATLAVGAMVAVVVISLLLPLVSLINGLTG